MNIDTIISIISLVVGIAIGIGGILAGYRIAKKSGVFKKAELSLSLYEKFLTPNPQFGEVIFGYPPVNKEDMVIGILPFTITNSGQLSAKNVLIRIIFPLIIRPGFRDEIFEFYDILGPYDKSDIKRISFKREGFEYVDYKIPEIHPGWSISIEEAISIKYASGMPFKVDAISKDGVPLQIDGYLKWTINPIRVWISAIDVTPLEGHFAVRSCQAKDLEELSQKITEDETQALRKELRKLGAPEQIISHAYAPVREKAIVVMPKLNEIPKPKKYSSTRWSAYLEDPKKSKKWLITPEGDVEAI